MSRFREPLMEDLGPLHLFIGLVAFGAFYVADVLWYLLPSVLR